MKTRSTLEALILVGAFDHFGLNRATLLHSIDEVLDDVSDVEQDGFIFETLTPKVNIEEKEELPDNVLSDYEREYLGFYITKHPMEKLFEKKQQYGMFQIANSKDNQPLLIQIDEVKRIRTKKGQNMAFVTLNDGRDTLDGVLFPNVYKRYEIDLQDDKPFICYGKYETRNDKLQLIINDLMSVEQFEEQKMKQAKYLVVQQPLQNEGQKGLLKQQETGHDLPVYYYNQAQQQIEPIGVIERNRESIQAFLELFSPRDVRIV